jgi:hypothetical protein
VGSTGFEEPHDPREIARLVAGAAPNAAPSTLDPDLEAVVETWPTLTPEERRAIVAVVARRRLP